MPSKQCRRLIFIISFANGRILRPDLVQKFTNQVLNYAIIFEAPEETTPSS